MIDVFLYLFPLKLSLIVVFDVAENIVQELREQVQELTRQKDSLQHTVGMLRHKIAKVGERQIENERRLKIYANLEPVFEELTSVFKFDSAEDIINRLNQLENTNVCCFSTFS